MDVSIIIVNYNTFDLTKNTIESVFEKTNGITYEVILIDNNSLDGSGQKLKIYFGNKIKYLQNINNIGFGCANNIAMKCAQGKYLFLLNSDTVLLNNAIKIFFNFYEQFPASDKIGVIGTNLLDKDLNPTASFDAFPTVSGTLKYYFCKIFKKIYIPCDNESLYFSVDTISGAALFLAKSTIAKIGEFDPRFFLYFEETDLQKRMSENGLMRYIINGPKIIHYQGGSSLNKNKSALQKIMFDNSRFKYLKKHSSVYAYYLFRISYILIILPILLDRQYSFKDRIKIFSNTLT